MSQKEGTVANKVPILVVDDNKDDVFFLCRAFEKEGFDNSIIHVWDGQEAVDYLRGENGFEDRSRYPLPSLMVLDIKMPKLNGFDVLQWLLTRDDLEKFPVVMLSSSPQPEDMERARDLGAADYLTKPVDVEAFGQVVQNIAKLLTTPRKNDYATAA